MESANSDPTTGDSIELARQRLTAAENSVRAAKHESKLAKQRRKEAKKAARRAKKSLRRAKKELAEATRLFSETEKKNRRETRTFAKGKKVTKMRLAKVAASKPARKKTEATNFSVLEAPPREPRPSEEIQVHVDSASEPPGESVPGGPAPGSDQSDSSPGN